MTTEESDAAGNIRGETVQSVTRALAERDPLPGLDGFAGTLPKGRLIRDVLGREPLFVDGEDWAFSREPLSNPVEFPAGHVSSPGGEPQPCFVLPEANPDDCSKARRALGAAVDRSLRALPRNIPVGFSGGLDSGLVASGTSGPCYVVGFPDSPVLDTARQAAERLDRDLRVIELSPSDLETAIPTVVASTGRTNAIDVAIGLTLFALGEAVAADGYDRIALGQGADELFGGYEKVAAAPEDTRVAASTIRGARDELLGTIPTQCTRDVCVLRAAGVEPLTPLLSDRMVQAALCLPESLLVADGIRKRGLRQIASSRLPASIANRDKRALQYGSRVHRELDRLARQAGFKRRMDDHVRTYIESQCRGSS